MSAYIYKPTGRRIYKHGRLDPEQLRRKRGDEKVQLRKEKRREAFYQQRHFNVNEFDFDWESVSGDEVDCMGKDCDEVDCMGRDSDGSTGEGHISPDLVAAMYTDDPEAQLYASHEFRKLQSKGAPVLTETGGGTIIKALEFLDSTDEHTIESTLEFLIVPLLIIPREANAPILEAIIPRLKSLLNHSSADVQFRAVPIVKFLGMAGAHFINQFLTQGLLPAFVELLYMADYKTRVEATYAALVLTQNATVEQLVALIKGELLESMVSMLTSPDAQVLASAIDVYLASFNRLKGTEHATLVSHAFESTAAIDHINKLSTHNHEIVSKKASCLLDAHESMSNDMESECFGASQTVLAQESSMKYAW